MKIRITLAVALIALMTLAGCVGPAQTASTSPTVATSSTATSSLAKTTSTPPVQAAETGLIQMWVTDAPRTDNVSEIWVTVSQAEIHEAVGIQASDNASGETEAVTDNSTDTTDWISANLTGPARFDLLTLRGDNGGLQQVLATANLSVGRYTQVRLTITKVEVNINGVLQDGVLPSGKLKFVHPFDVQAGSVTKLLFDFNADQFVTITGSPVQPEIIVKPAVKLTVSKPQSAATSGGKLTTTPGRPEGAGPSLNQTGHGAD